jgi:hypothetical protein
MNLKKMLSKFCIMKKVRDKANETEEKYANIKKIINSLTEY